MRFVGRIFGSGEILHLLNLKFHSDLGVAQTVPPRKLWAGKCWMIGLPSSNLDKVVWLCLVELSGNLSPPYETNLLLKYQVQATYTENGSIIPMFWCLFGTGLVYILVVSLMFLGGTIG